MQQKTGPRALKFRIIIAGPPFYRSVAFRGPPGDVPLELDINA